MKWSDNSPDFAPIEMWAVIKAKLSDRDGTTKHELIAAVLNISFHDPKVQESCEKLADSMPKYIASVLVNDGRHIRYKLHPTAIS